MVIISPSGNLYGSEQVLIDYLESSNQNHTVYVPKKSLLLTRLQPLNKHNIKTYDVKRLKFLYIIILFKLLFNKSELYINEAGHIRYIKLLAKIFKHKNFFVHIRIIEDTKETRLSILPSNIILITVSNFMLYNLQSYKCVMLYDPYPFIDKEIIRNIKTDNFRIGIVGRITKTKGFYLIEKFIEKVNSTTNSEAYNFIFFGSISADVKKSFEQLSAKNNNVIYQGFIAEKEEIYNNIDLLLHFNSNEPLGRIILEAIDFHKPFICSSEGGTGEITELVGLKEFTINFFTDDWEEILFKKIDSIKNNYQFFVEKVSEAKLIAKSIFSTVQYVNKLESIFKL